MHTCEHCCGGYRTDYSYADHYGVDNAAIRACDNNQPCVQHRCYYWPKPTTDAVSRVIDAVSRLGLKEQRSLIASHGDAWGIAEAVEAGHLDPQTMGGEELRDLGALAAEVDVRI